MFSFSRTGTGDLDISGRIVFEKDPCGIMYIPIVFLRNISLQAPFLVAAWASQLLFDLDRASKGFNIYCDNMDGILLADPAQNLSVVVLISDKGCRNITFKKGDARSYTCGGIFKLNLFKLPRPVWM